MTKQNGNNSILVFSPGWLFSGRKKPICTFFERAVVQERQNFIIRPCKLLSAPCAIGTHNIWIFLLDSEHFWPSAGSRQALTCSTRVDFVPPLPPFKTQMCLWKGLCPQMLIKDPPDLLGVEFTQITPFSKSQNQADFLRSLVQIL